jgi:bifunctional DNA-binding transcriptional regulator/antitoxin component of YhaV-PrlF toxin-antitoxin module
MKIQFVKPNVANINVKATVHINGKLGFSKAATKKFGLDEGKFIKIGVNSEDENDKNLYVIIKNFDDGESLKIHKAGQYYYVNTRQLFDSLSIDYLNKKIIYDVEDFEYSNIKMYKFVKRELDRNRMEQDEESYDNDKE